MSVSQSGSGLTERYKASSSSSAQARRRSSFDPLEAVLVGVRIEAGPEAANLPVDGGPVPTARLEAHEAAGFVPGHPETDELGVLDDGSSDIVADEGWIVVDGADRGFTGGLGPDVVRHGVPVEPEAAVGDAPALGAIAGVGTEVGGVTHIGSQVCDCIGRLSRPLFKKFPRYPELIG